MRHQPAQLPDIMATFLDLADAEYPETFNGNAIQPLEGFSMTPTFDNGPHTRETLVWEHEGNRAVRSGKWKLVSKHPGPWELYDMETDRAETRDLADAHGAIVAELSESYRKWAERCGVLSWNDLLERRRERKPRESR